MIKMIKMIKNKFKDVLAYALAFFMTLILLYLVSRFYNDYRFLGALFFIISSIISLIINLRIKQMNNAEVSLKQYLKASNFLNEMTFSLLSSLFIVTLTLGLFKLTECNLCLAYLLVESFRISFTKIVIEIVNLNNKSV